MKKMFFALLLGICVSGVAFGANGGDDKALTPLFKQSSYVNESVTLENPYITMNFFKRIKGWGWGEIHTPEGKLMAAIRIFRCVSRPIRSSAKSRPKPRV